MTEDIVQGERTVHLVKNDSKIDFGLTLRKSSKKVGFWWWS